MADPIKILGVEQVCNTTPNTFNSATLVRITNLDNTYPTLITLKASSNSTIGTITVNGTFGDDSVVFLMKDPTDTLSSNNASSVFGVAVGFY